MKEHIVVKTVAIFVFFLIASATMATEGDLAPVASSQATIIIDAQTPTKAYDRMIFGGFLEHFDNQIYGGIFEPGSPRAIAP